MNKTQIKLTPKILADQELFYSIPIYQRLFEWGEDEILTLMNDLLKSFNVNDEHTKDYFIGLLTTTHENELIDGQQRFTVMILLSYVLKKYDSRWEKFLCSNSKSRLTFAARPFDNSFLKKLFDSAQDEISHNETNSNTAELNLKMKNGIDVITAFIDSKEVTSKKKFASYIFDHLCFFITTLPESYNPQDLNMYFERMNTYGKNLEQQDILKVKLLCNLGGNINNYILLWNKISDVDSLLIHIKEKEKAEDLTLRKTKAIYSSLQDIFNKPEIINGLDKEENENEKAIIDIPMSTKKPEIENNAVKEHHCALSFPYLLLNTLYLFLNKNNKKINNISDFFDQINLLDTFQKYLPYEGDNVNTNEIKQFMELLLKCRLALDICFIRPAEFGYYLDMNLDEDNESLKQLMMFESMLYVSSSNNTNYRWFCWLMNALLNAKKEFPTAEKLYKILKKQDDNLEEHKLPKIEELTYGEIRYWLWRLDFYIWNNRKEIFKNSEDALIVASKFIFRKNRSIEHIAPQTPKSNSNMQWCNSDKDRSLRDSFGNLVMISQGLNSSLRNESFELKKAHVDSYIRRSKTGSIESLKLLLVFSHYENWDRKLIEEHGREAYGMLSKSYNNE